ncbi:LuxR C-terminal-related transcriptional regulator [Cohnella silvisoli]|uniref:LuxR C-terminal-related transcriptional regulator n=1 Tax=Cohnella silvisoli TaxID=2873699 RepID=A0ABV1KZ38_9BACL|nr:LuxR C-terminal-related transcriptional regulator [Cohnella silvisoli]MCD9024696.1 LuxR C-terminal-related transcriptional regulator [Cohnella silvisoli]
MNLTVAADYKRLNDLLMESMDPAMSSFSSRYQITLRESEILILIAVYGFSNREIAEQCAITEKTVKNHIANVMNKLGVKSMRKLLSLLFSYVLSRSFAYGGNI